MSKYLSLFEQDNEYRESSKTLPNVSNVIEDEVVYYQDDYSGEYLTFKILSDGEVGWNQHSTLNREVQYSLNGGIWTTLPISGISVTRGDKVRFKATCTGYSNTYAAQNYFTATAKLDIYGNIASLIQGDEFTTSITISNWAFAYLFYNLPVVSAKNLTLCGSSYGCFFHLFHGCTQLIDAPSLIDITLVSEIFGGMFCGCTSLVVAPQIPMVNNNNFKTFGTMFYGCTSLKVAPKLPSTTSSKQQYYYMFYNCTSLEEAPELPATVLSQDCYSYMFYGCTSLKTAPVLAAPTLVQGCYQSMFQGCSSLNHITCLATDISATDCTTNWVSGVAATGTFIKAAGMEDWTTGNNGIPEGWTTTNKVITQEYITANGQIETDFQLTSDNYKIVSSYYIPSIDASWKTMYYFNNGVYHQLVKNNNKLGLYFVRYNASNQKARLIEQIESISDASSSTGTNVVTYVNHPANLGYGAYYDYTTGLSSAQNNYPYETWDGYLETKPSMKTTYSKTVNSNNIEIQNLKLLSSAPTGTRFYGIKVWSEDDNQVVFDGVPAKYGTEDAIYDKVSGHFYTTSQIITT